ncbi:MAG: bifunctional glutamate--cysteine ligase GshA/glutathione synthetase GshB [Alkalibacterium sp.]|nr:bifunctional glutamate--cysteine ligase GshA/glutathione synthetase GshB [Alkalibacterium sp.]TVP92423.1 MAG: bifunctional glutamate--cysteine ligase GshA/glutathione synthetase GshB [Alkalibacterium sp.]
MTIKRTIIENDLQELFKEGSFGLEKEGLRSSAEGYLALTPHPKSFGSRNHHPYIQTDFSESQLELVTPPQDTIEDQYKWLEALHDVVNRTLDESEFVWPFSMPNLLPDEGNIPIIKVDDVSEIEYRQKLAEKYGKKKQMISGVHFNFSFSEAFISAMGKDMTTSQEFNAWCNDLYLKMSRNYLRYQWILTYLFGASPVGDVSFLGDEEPKNYFRSIRNSSIGYHNNFSHRVSYENIKKYVTDIEALVRDKDLIEEREYYGSSRLRGKGKAVCNLINSGTSYVEFRSFDLNPFEKLGFSVEQSLFTHLFLLTMVWMDSDSTDEDIEKGSEMNEHTAMENPFDYSRYLDEGLSLLNQMMETAEDLNLSNEYIDTVKNAIDEFHHPEKTLAARIVREIEREGSFIKLGIRLGQEYKQLSYVKPFLLSGFDTLEMSTQLLLSDCLQLGIDTTILDETDQFLKLKYAGQVEYVRNGNMTAKDTYISHWIMANKTVTKKIVKDAGFTVAEGREYINLEQALNQYAYFKNSPIVIKPKSTNYGIGISIFKKPASFEAFKEALKLAFEEDSEVLIEEFAEGTEYRFFVINGKTEAVLLRKPANVVGDGKSTVRELIARKNQHPYRGEKHRAPLEKIKTGKIEELMLKEQGYTFETVLEKGEQALLRENSNISTGGDSIDLTDEMDESYKQLAARIAKALDVKVTGIDLIIPDRTKPVSKREDRYVFIEANFNPAMHMHAFLQAGTGVNLTKKIIRMLYPTIETS